MYFFFLSGAARNKRDEIGRIWLRLGGFIILYTGAIYLYVLKVLKFFRENYWHVDRFLKVNTEKCTVVFLGFNHLLISLSLK